MCLNLHNAIFFSINIDFYLLGFLQNFKRYLENVKSIGIIKFTLTLQLKLLGQSVI